MSREAVEGVLLGTAVGDALGLPYENVSPGRAAMLLGPPDRYRFLFGRGMISDDTEHACLVAAALAASACDPVGFERELARGLRWWLVGLPAGLGWATLRACLRLWCGFSPACSGVPSAGNGPAMRSAVLGAAIGDLAQLAETVRRSTRITHTDPRAEVGAQAVALAACIACRTSGDPRPAFEAALERLFSTVPGRETVAVPSKFSDSQTGSAAPNLAAIAAPERNPSTAGEKTVALSESESPAAEPRDSASAEPAATVDALAESSPPSPTVALRSTDSASTSAGSIAARSAAVRQFATKENFPAIEDFRTRFAAVLRSLDAGETTPEFARGFCRGAGVSGYIFETVPVALHAWLRHPEDYSSGVSGAIFAGGDADTTAAIVGGLIGARTGPAGIPEKLVAGLFEPGRPPSYFRRLAEAVSEAQTTGRPTVPPGISLANLWPRNLLFLAIVVCHALRRLLPPYGPWHRPATATKPGETTIESPRPSL